MQTCSFFIQVTFSWTTYTWKIMPSGPDMKMELNKDLRKAAERTTQHCQCTAHKSHIKTNPLQNTRNISNGLSLLYDCFCCSRVLN